MLAETWFKHRELHAEYQKRSDAYQRQAQHQIAKSCVGITGMAFSECVARELAAYEHNKPADEDLRAQQDMALWALWMVIAAGATFIVTAAGIYFVRETLIETRNAVAETAKATELLGQDFIAAHPPKIKVFQAHLDFEELFEPTGKPLGGVYTVNVGGSDAKIIGFGAAKPETYGNIVLIIGEHPPDRKPFDVARFANPLNIKAGRLKAGDSLWWDIVDASMISLTDLRRILDNESDDKLFMIGRVHFTDTRGGRRQTVFCRVYDPDIERFTRADIPDYEYQA